MDAVAYAAERRMNMPRYIDVNALIAEYDRVHVGAPGGARKLMVEAPTADVVEVVRCEDCQFCEKVECIITQNILHFCVRKTNQFGVSATDFCSYGKRKEK